MDDTEIGSKKDKGEAASTPLLKSDFLEDLEREYGSGPVGPQVQIPIEGSHYPTAGVRLDYHDEELGSNPFSDDTAGESLLNRSASEKAEKSSAPAVDMWCGCLSLPFYQRFFQVDTADVFERLKLTFLFFWPKSKPFLEEIGDNPDFYGPFWVCMSLIFVQALAANLHGWAFFSGTGGWTYDAQVLITCCLLVYSFMAAVPVLSFITFRKLDIPVTFPQILSVYGYSLAIFIPMTFLCLIPNNIAIWLLLAFGGICSSVFLVRSLAKLLAEACPAHALKIIAAVGSANLLFFLMEKILLF